MRQLQYLRWLSLCVVLLWSATPAAAAPTILATGDWSPVIGSGQLQAGAGSDLAPTLESPAAQVTLDIAGTLGDGDAWRIEIRRTDVSWPIELTLEIQRTGDGMGTGSILGGGSYLTIDEVDQELCTGAGDRAGITAQLRLGGLSLQIPPAIYSTTLTYTVIDT